MLLTNNKARYTAKCPKLIRIDRRPEYVLAQNVKILEKEVHFLDFDTLQIVELMPNSILKAESFFVLPKKIGKN